MIDDLINNGWRHINHKTPLDLEMELYSFDNGLYKGELVILSGTLCDKDTQHKTKYQFWKSPTFVVFDLDGTLANNKHRQHFVENKPKNWTAFFDNCDKDTLNESVFAAFKGHVALGHRVEIWTGRTDRVMGKTVKWLFNAGIKPKRLTRMRHECDYTVDHVLKEKWMKEDRPDLVYDDRDKVVKMWRENGIDCFQVAPGDF